MAAQNIQIDESHLNTLRDQYKGYTDDIKKRATTAFPWTTATEINMDAAFTTRLGNSAFNSGQKLTGAIEAVRQNLFGRMQATYTDTYDVYAGIVNLLKDTDAVEHLNTLTGDQFDSYIPTSPPSLGTGTGTGTGTTTGS